MFKTISPLATRAAIVFGITLLLSSAITSFSFLYMDGVEQDKIKAHRDMRKWQKKINRSVENNQIIEQFETNFLKLVKQGVVGAEDRLSWLESIQKTAKDRGMPSVKYAISSQLLLKEDNLEREYRGIDVFKSVMSLDVKMAHEGDLFALLNNLNYSDGLFAVDKCEIKKVSRTVTDSVNNMTASCDLGWYTFKGSNVK